jgi:hypothetical protein
MIDLDEVQRAVEQYAADNGLPIPAPVYGDNAERIKLLESEILKLKEELQLCREKMAQGVLF